MPRIIIHTGPRSRVTELRQDTMMMAGWFASGMRSTPELVHDLLVRFDGPLLTPEQKTCNAAVREQAPGPFAVDVEVPAGTYTVTVEHEGTLFGFGMDLRHAASFTVSTPDAIPYPVAGVLSGLAVDVERLDHCLRPTIAVCTPEPTTT